MTLTDVVTGISGALPLTRTNVVLKSKLSYPFTSPARTGVDDSTDPSLESDAAVDRKRETTTLSGRRVVLGAADSRATASSVGLPMLRGCASLALWGLPIGVLQVHLSFRAGCTGELFSALVDR